MLLVGFHGFHGFHGETIPHHRNAKAVHEIHENSSGWWCQPLSKILVSWDDYSQYMEKYKMFQTTNQSCSSPNRPSPFAFPGTFAKHILCRCSCQGWCAPIMNVTNLSHAEMIGS